MNKNLLFVSLFLLFSLSVLAQKDINLANNTISGNSPEIKAKEGPKKNVIKIYPNPTFGKFSVSANTSLPLHFYIFDLEGTLIYQAVLTDKQKKTIDNLKKGTYLYDVFEKDESIEEGKIVIK